MNNNHVQDLKSKVTDLLSSGNHTHGLGRALRNLSKEINLYENYEEGKKQFESNVRQFDFTKIQIGGGAHVLDGFVNIDIVPPADIVWDVREGLPVPNSAVEFVFTEHFFEHIDYPKSAKKVMSELGRIVKVGGSVVLGVPDTEMAVNGYTHKDEQYYETALATWYSKRSILGDFNTYIDLLNFHMRDQDDDPKYNPHMWGYDFEKLKSLFQNVGFRDVQPWKFDSTIANPKREWGSVYVIAHK